MVSPRDPAFKDPGKPVGPTYTRDEMDIVMKLDPSVAVKEIVPGKYRRVVPSPDPISVLESSAVKDLVKQGYVVVAAGGGGIPVFIDKKEMRFVSAVVDKDLAGERLATSINASKFVSLTDVDGVYLEYRGEKPRLLNMVTVKEMKKFLKRGEFEEGSMGPKVKAAIRFAENTGHKAIIANLNKIREALEGTSGTTICR
jgi:carbamate kinase